MTELNSLLTAAAGSGNGLAVVDANGQGPHRTWATVHHDARHAAAGLARLGVRPGDRVAIQLQADASAVTALFAVWQAGATVVSLPEPTRANMVGYRQAFLPLLDQLAVDVVIGDARLNEVLAPRTIRPFAAVTSETPVAGDLPVPEEALIQFTSGSTSMPSGVSVSEAALRAQILAVAEHLAIDPRLDRSVSWLPLSHDMGLIGFLLIPAATGIDAVIGPPAAFARNPRYWTALLAQQRATVTGGPDFAFRAVARAAAGDRDERSLASVKAWICGGERVHATSMEQFHAALARRGVRWESLMPGYGMAEAVLAVSLNELDRGPRTAGEHVALGRPLPGIEVRAAAEVRAGSGPAALALRGPSTFDGYRRAGGGFDRRNRDDWFVTGDAGHVDAAGEVFVAGRLDEVVIVRGRNIYAEDLEHAVIAGGVPVVGVAALRRLGHDDQFDVVVAAPAAARPQSAAELARQVRSLLREASAAPVNAVHVVPPSRLPRTTSGKVRRADCRRLITQGEYVSVSGG